MRIDQLIYLIEVSHSHSLNLAAEALHISTQALSASFSGVFYSGSNPRIPTTSPQHPSFGYSMQHSRYLYQLTE